MNHPASFHEGFDQRERATVGSARSFGFAFAILFALVGIKPTWSGHAVRAWAIAIGLILALVALAAPRLLRPLQGAWAPVASLVQQIVSNVALGVLFAAFIVVGWVRRHATKYDPLRLRRNPELRSYWIERNSAGSSAASMRRQF